MSTVRLETEDHRRDAEFNKAMHGSSAKHKAGFASMLSKDRQAHKAAADDYWKHWDAKAAADETPEIRECFECNSDRMVDQLRAKIDHSIACFRRVQSNLICSYISDQVKTMDDQLKGSNSTDLYEYGWGACFHFCRFTYGEGFHQAIARHEHYLAHMMGIRQHMRVLDVGCGVGGPAREIAKFSGANIVGLNNNDYQIERATHYAATEGLSQQLSFTKGDFMVSSLLSLDPWLNHVKLRQQMSFPAESFDAVYAIEATVHAPSLEGVYSQIYRVLKPGGVFGVYEWLMTDAYDNENPHHREIRLGIEQGDGISNMVRVSEGVKAMKAAGFELEVNYDLADNDDARPWYYPLDGNLRMVSSIGDFFTIARMTRLGRFTIHNAVGLLERFGLVPQGTKKTADSLGLAADCLTAGGKERLFTPMYLMVGRKPA